jgi:lipopolysaccharide export system protein LptC
MTRLVTIAMLLAILPASAWGQSTEDDTPVVSPSWQTKMAEVRPPNYSLQGAGSAATAPSGSSTRMFASTEVSSHATVGFGLFGLKTERSLQPHVTGYDARKPRSRRAAIGLSLKF